MNKFILLILASLIFLSYISYSQSRTWKEHGSPCQNNKKVFCSIPLMYESGRTGEDYYIGPEIPVTGASGFYDYQSIGDCRHYIDRSSSTELHAVFLRSTDSMNNVSTRRTAYCFSDDQGVTWTFITTIPDAVVSDFPSLSSLSTGEALISNNFVGAFNNFSYAAYDVAPGAGSFTTASTPSQIFNPGCTRLSDGTVLLSGTTMINSSQTDSAVVTIFNDNTHTFSNTHKFTTGDFIDQSNMRITCASGPDGRALILLSPVNDNGSTAGFNRMFIAFTTNSGQTWSQPQIFYNPGLLNGQIAIPFRGIDAVYDNSGNYYVAFNTTDTSGNYSSAKLWVSKNGGTPVIIAQHTGSNSIAEAANTLSSPQAGFCTIDHPSLSVSSNGSLLFVTYSVMFQNDTLNEFNKCHIYVSCSLTNILNFSNPIGVTNAGPNSFDERYSSIARISPDISGSSGITVYLVYQKDPQPGSCANGDNAPISRSSLVFRIMNGFQTFPGVIQTNSEIPLDSDLRQNYPNPFNPETQIEFELNIESNVKLLLYDINGRFLENIYSNENASAGKYTYLFNGSNYSSGVYFISLQIVNKNGKSQNLSRKMLLVK
ncbi:MAG: T9SS type A sorting domain-containing protein [Ignavibacteria bacterium]